MKDLKHLLYFENLLQEAHNDLVAQAQNEGKICVAYGVVSQNGYIQFLP